MIACDYWVETANQVHTEHCTFESKSTRWEILDTVLLSSLM